MAGELNGIKVAVLATDGVEQVELDRPWQALEEAGAEPELVSLDGGTITTFDHIDKGDTRKVDAVVSSADPDSYGGLVLPGGVINGDFVRADADAVAFVTAFFDAGKPVAAICHAPWVLAEADVVKGRRMTSWPSLRTDLRNAGAGWVDEEVVVERPDHQPQPRRPRRLRCRDRRAVRPGARGGRRGQRLTLPDAQVAASSPAAGAMVSSVPAITRIASSRGPTGSRPCR